MLKKSIIASSFIILTQGVYAQQPPSAGTLIPSVPIIQNNPSTVELPKVNEPTLQGDEGATIMVNNLKVTGSNTYSEAELLKVSGFVPNKELSLLELRQIAAKIAQHYHQNGYFVAQAYLPAQEIKEGQVTINVMEGQYGNVIIKNNTNLSDAQAKAYVDNLKQNNIISASALETDLLLLSDLPGINVKSTLTPGQLPGQSDLIVELNQGKKVTGSVDVDNAGNRYTGAARFGATLNLNEPTGHGDIASLRVITSGQGLNYARASYGTQFGKLKAGAAYSYLDYSLGKEFSSLGATGNAKIASVYASYPLIRSRQSNLYSLLSYEQKTFHDNISSTPSSSDKRSSVITAGMYGDHRDQWNGFNSYYLNVSSANLSLKTPSDKTIDASTSQTNGSFNKVSFGGQHLQPITPRWSVNVALSGQLASKNLDVSEKMSLGGMQGVRAYPEGETYADEGYVLNLETRYLLPSLVTTGQLQAIGFIDTGTVRVNKNPWLASSNNKTLSGYGLGFIWADYNNFEVKGYYARKINNNPALSAPDKSGRFWLQAVKYF